MPEKLLTREDAEAVLAERGTETGHVLGVVTLNAPQTLNSLTLGMIDAIDAQLRAWEHDDRVVAVVLRGSGERAFCAGGDIQALYRAIRRNLDAGDQVDDYAETFFEHEYRLDYLVHTFRKPIVCWAHGVTMGGGLGLLSGASHRVVSETVRVAMPEITIGLFPDAGGTWLLSRMPGRLGLFLGLTGAHLNGSDARDVGLAHALVAGARQADFERALAEAQWTGHGHDDRERLDALLADFDAGSESSRPAAQLQPHAASINDALNAAGSQSSAKVRAILELKGRDRWLDRAAEGLERGCPMTAAVIDEQLARAEHMSLPDMFKMEMVIAARCARGPDFAEGVRALLIEKDNAPRWAHASVAEVTEAELARHFTPPWERNPLEDLGRRP